MKLMRRIGGGALVPDNKTPLTFLNECCVRHYKRPPMLETVPHGKRVRTYKPSHKHVHMKHTHATRTRSRSNECCVRHYKRPPKTVPHGKRTHKHTPRSICKNVTCTMTPNTLLNECCVPMFDTVANTRFTYNIHNYFLLLMCVRCRRSHEAVLYLREGAEAARQCARTHRWR